MHWIAFCAAANASDLTDFTLEACFAQTQWLTQLPLLRTP